jgi:hypothetical protein
MIKIAKMPPFVSFRAYPTDSNSAPPVAAAIGVNFGNECSGRYAALYERLMPDPFAMHTPDHDWDQHAKQRDNEVGAHSALQVLATIAGEQVLHGSNSVAAQQGQPDLLSEQMLFRPALGFGSPRSAERPSIPSSTASYQKQWTVHRLPNTKTISDEMLFRRSCTV